MTRLAIFTTHPIQYQAPWFRALAAESGLDVKVFFSYVPDAIEQGVGFGRALTWDIPLREGYSSEVLASRLLSSRVPSFARRPVKAINAALDTFEPDVALVFGWQEISLVQALFACRSRGIPIILRGESNALRKRPRAVSAIHRRYFRMCDVFLAIGKSNAAFYREAGVPGDRILTAGYFVDNDRFTAAASGLRSDRETLRNHWNVPNDAICFAFAGKLEPKKCVMHFLQAIDLARRSGPVHGIVIGSGQQAEEAQSYCREHALPVTFAGFLNQTEIVRGYVACDALVLPSDYGETWGLVVNEAMACGLPAIVSDHVGCAQDLVIEGMTGLTFPHGDIEALADRMLALARSKVERDAMGQAASKLVRETYSIEQAVAQTRRAIDLVLELRLGRRP